MGAVRLLRPSVGRTRNDTGGSGWGQFLIEHHQYFLRHHTFRGRMSQEILLSGFIMIFRMIRACVLAAILILSVIIPCLASDTSVTKEYLHSALDDGNASQEYYTPTIFTIVAQNRTPSVSPGGNIEIDIFITGYGISQKNKLYISWSAPYVIDKEKPGYLATSFDYDPTTQIASRGQAAYKTWDIPPEVTGAEFGFNSLGLFYAVKPVDKPYLFPDLASEHTWDDYPPFFLSLKTDSKAPAGDYQVSITLTYGNETDPKQDSKLVQFHIESLWERSELPLAIFGGVVALIALMITAAGTIWQMVRWCRGK